MVTTTKAVNIIEVVTTTKAVDIIEEVTTTKAANIIEEVTTNKAADIIEEVTTDKAVDIIEVVTTTKAVDIIEVVATDKASAVMEELTTEKLTNTISVMSETSLAERLPGLSPDKLYSVEPEVLFDSLPNAPTEQLVSEELPEPPAEAEAPIAVFTTPSGARYLTIQTWAGEWVIVMGTPPPVDQLMIKTKQALKDVETSLEVFEEQPSEVAIGLPADQIVRAYISITFENAAPEDIELGHMTFKVEREWLEQNSIHKWSVALNRYDPELAQWIALPTKRLDEDNSYVYYTVAITHFSIFAISGSQALPTSNFEVANLAINPAKAKTGENITISADITNLSNTAGTYAITLWIDGTVEAGKNVSLEANATTPMSFIVIRDVEGGYQVRFDRLFGSFNVTEAPPAPLKPPINWRLIGGLIAGVIIVAAIILVPLGKGNRAL